MEVPLVIAATGAIIYFYSKDQDKKRTPRPDNPQGNNNAPPPDPGNTTAPGTNSPGQQQQPPPQPVADDPGPASSESFPVQRCSATTFFVPYANYPWSVNCDPNDLQCNARGNPPATGPAVVSSRQYNPNMKATQFGVAPGVSKAFYFVQVASKCPTPQ